MSAFRGQERSAEALSLFGSRKLHRKLSGESTPQLSSVTGRAAPIRFRVADCGVDTHHLISSGLHMKILDQAPSVPALYYDAWKQAFSAFPHQRLHTRSARASSLPPGLECRSETSLI